MRSICMYRDTKNYITTSKCSMIAISTRSCLPGSCLDVRKVTYLIVLQEKKIMVSSATTLKVM